jgi:hypothetical protein
MHAEKAFPFSHSPLPSRRAGVSATAWLFVVAVCCGCGGGGGSEAAPSDDSGAPWTNDAGGSSSDGSSGGNPGSGDTGAGPKTGVDAGGGADASADGGADASPPLSGRQALVWIPTYVGSFSANLNKVTGSSPKAFTQVSPDFYNLNYDYQNGPARIAAESFDGLSVAQVAQQVHAAGMRLIPLVYAGAGNGGTDQGVQNILSDSPPGTQNNFITAMVQEAQMRHYDGWNLDFEVGGNTGYTKYGVLYGKFLAAFKAALHAQNMILTIDIGSWFMRQCGGDGLVDVTQIGPSVDSAIIMDYSGTYGSPVSSCPGGTPPSQPSCADEFGAQMNLMCDVSPTSAVSIGLIEGQGGSGTNPFLDQALSAIGTAGFTSVAAWPDDNTFLNSANIPNGGTWYSLFAAYLAGH